MESYRVVPAWAGAVIGLVAGAVALGVAYVVAAVVGPTSFPVVAVGDAAVDLAPASAKEWAIATFGENDKAVLVTGVVVVLTLVAALLGVLSRRSVGFGQAGFAVFGVVGLLAALTRPDSGVADGLSTVVGALAGSWTLTLLFRRAVESLPATSRFRLSDGEGGPGARSGIGDSAAGVGPSRSGAGDPRGGPMGSSGEALGDAGDPRGGPMGSSRGALGDAGDSGVGVVGSSGEALGDARDSRGDGERPEVRERVAELGAGPLERERPAVMRAGAELYAFDRRRLMIGLAGGIAVAGAAAVAGQVLSGRRVGDTARVGVALPKPATPAKPLPAGADLRIGGLSPFVTPNKDFYRVDTAIIVPQVNPNDWTLRIHGMVDRPIELTFDDLLKRPLTEADITLTCVSNEVGGPYVGNARWLGARMADVLREAGIQRNADMLLSTSADGFTCGTPVDVVMDGRDALFAIAMNGEALPVDHGFPARQVVPGLYGYVSATKWVVDIKVTRFDTDEAYWTPRGWAAKGPIKTQSRIDVPKAGARLKRGRTTIAGVAWAQHTGVEAVEVRIDGGAWQQARLAVVPGPDTWRQWAFDWDATPGGHTIEVRATDAAGRTQTERQTSVAPDGATGWHTISVRVD
ncbi:molybdopterin-dependent oxidoreductase [Nonomuraea sp. bgisy101]|uniref:molybdopterin-dependent oxidoreductase n=1 Tax=Nonomuraea sp. bgisy101 TaxID=3413784 RepID=UPI003D71D240